ncbi:substrate-binding domain-containing protein [Salipiger pacificus]|nr:substrate-binding domain-containing protein [Alloyangia pacifica]MCA0943880.1 substrate-binding domain-containing protein [Alloyangia pacifica]
MRRGPSARLASADRPQAIYYSNDDLLAGGIIHCLAEGIAIPTELALAGFNGLSFLEARPIRLTTIETPRLERGRRAALLLIEEGEIETAEQPQRVDLGFRLMGGETC